MADEMKLVERGLVFSGEDQVAERLGWLEPGDLLVGFSSRGMIELRRVSEFAYAVELYDFRSRISHIMRRPLKLSGVPLALRVVLEDAKGGHVAGYEFAVFKRLTPNRGGDVSCSR